MRIGFDFDNTIVDYTSVFTQIANHFGLKNENNPKNSIKYYFEEELDNPSSWKEVQLQVYCELIDNIKPCDKFSNLINWLVNNNHDFFIVSHKTETIKSGNSISNLRGPARKWIENNLPNFKKERIFFESSALAKVKKIKSLSLDFFVDDLITILNHHQFPKHTKKILFNCPTLTGHFLYEANNWDDVKEIILDNE
jgi:hypothetical protein